MRRNPGLSRKSRTVCAPQSGDCHQFPPLELAGCTRFAHDRHLAEQSRPFFIPPGEALPHNATDTNFPAQLAENWLSVPGFAPRQTLRLVVSP
jgi:hypothetical protein